MIHFLNDWELGSSYSDLYLPDLELEDHVGVNDILIFNKSKAVKILKIKDQVAEIKHVKLDVDRKGIVPVDIYQKTFLHHLEDESTPLVTCLAPPGCGKTYVTMWYIFEALEQKLFKQAIISKPLVGVSESRYLGTLPGVLEEKLSPFTLSFIDIANSLNRRRSFEDYSERELIKFEPIEFMRGRSFENSLIFVDEIQNLTEHELLTIGTRIGRGSKLILSGDPKQVDTQTLMSITNFVNHPKYLQSPYSATITLQKRMRSPITEIFEDILS